MRKMSSRSAITELTDTVRELPSSDAALRVSFKSEDLAALAAAIHDLGHSPHLVELVRSLVEALERHSGVLVDLIPIDMSDADRRRRDEIVSALIDQMTPELSVPTEAQVVQARRNAEARTQLIQEFGALSGDQIGEEHSRAQNRHALAARWRKERRIFGVPYRGQLLYPAFQFGDDGRLRPVVRRVLEALPVDEMSPWEVALWWTAGNGHLGGRRPVDLLGTAHEDDLVGAAAGLAKPSPL